MRESIEIYAVLGVRDDSAVRGRVAVTDFHVFPEYGNVLPPVSVDPIEIEETISAYGTRDNQILTITAPPGTPWMASAVADRGDDTTVDWVRFPNGNQGTGSGTLEFEVLGNDSQRIREAHISVVVNDTPYWIMIRQDLHQATREDFALEFGPDWKGGTYPGWFLNPIRPILGGDASRTIVPGEALYDSVMLSPGDYILRFAVAGESFYGGSSVESPATELVVSARLSESEILASKDLETAAPFDPWIPGWEFHEFPFSVSGPESQSVLLRFDLHALSDAGRNLSANFNLISLDRVGLDRKVSEISPLGVKHDAVLTRGTLSVQVPDGEEWSAKATAPDGIGGFGTAVDWVQFPEGSRGVGSGELVYEVSENLGVFPRQAVIFVKGGEWRGQNVSVVQSARFSGEPVNVLAELIPESPAVPVPALSETNPNGVVPVRGHQSWLISEFGRSTASMRLRPGTYRLRAAYAADPHDDREARLTLVASSGRLFSSGKQFVATPGLPENPGWQYAEVEFELPVGPTNFMSTSNVEFLFEGTAVLLDDMVVLGGDGKADFKVDRLSQQFSSSGGEGEISVSTVDGELWGVWGNSAEWISVIGAHRPEAADEILSFMVQPNLTGVERQAVIEVSQRRGADPRYLVVSQERQGAMALDLGEVAVPVANWSSSVPNEGVVAASGPGSWLISAGDSVAVTQLLAPGEYRFQFASAVDPRGPGYSQLMVAASLEGEALTGINSESLSTGLQSAPGWRVSAMRLVVPGDGTEVKPVLIELSAAASEVETPRADVLVDSLTISHAVEGALIPLHLSEYELAFPVDGGSQTVEIVTSDEEKWAASASSRWIQVGPEASGVGTGSLVIQMGENSSSRPRVGSVSVNGEQISIYQAGVDLTANPLNYANAWVKNPVVDQSQVFLLEGADCTIGSTYLNPADIIEAGDYRLRFAYAADPNSETEAGIEVLIRPSRAGQLLAELQRITAQPEESRAPGWKYHEISFSINTPSDRLWFDFQSFVGKGHMLIDDIKILGVDEPIPFELGSFQTVESGESHRGTVEIVAAPDKHWRVVDVADWVQFPLGRSGVGSGMLTYELTENPSGGERETVLTINNHHYRIVQLAVGDSPPEGAPEPKPLPFYVQLDESVERMAHIGVDADRGVVVVEGDDAWLLNDLEESGLQFTELLWPGSYRLRFAHAADPLNSQSFRPNFSVYEVGRSEAPLNSGDFFTVKGSQMNPRWRYQDIEFEVVSKSGEPVEIKFEFAAPSVNQPPSALLIDDMSISQLGEEETPMFELSPLVLQALYQGTSDSLTILAPEGLEWRAESSSDWLWFPVGDTGVGASSQFYQIEPNQTEDIRYAVLTVAGRHIVVEQFNLWWSAALQPFPLFPEPVSGSLEPDGIALVGNQPAPSDEVFTITESRARLLTDDPPGVYHGRVALIDGRYQLRFAYAADPRMDSDGEFTVNIMGKQTEFRAESTGDPWLLGWRYATVPFDVSDSESGEVEFVITKRRTIKGVSDIAGNILLDDIQVLDDVRSFEPGPFKLENVSALHPATESQGRIRNLNVWFPSGWEVSTAAEWITLGRSRGLRDSPIGYTVAPNPGTEPRHALIKVGNLRFSVVQLGVGEPPLGGEPAPEGPAFPLALKLHWEEDPFLGGGGSPPGAPRGVTTITESRAWILRTQESPVFRARPNLPAGSYLLRFALAADPNGAQGGSVTARVAGVRRSYNVGSTGSVWQPGWRYEELEFQVGPDEAGEIPISIEKAEPGRGSSANAGNVLLDDLQIVKIGEGEAPAFAVSPIAARHGASATEGWIEVMADGSDSWTASSEADWIRLGLREGTGPSSFGYLVDVNLEPEPRHALIKLGDLRLSVVQFGGSPNLGHLQSGNNLIADGLFRGELSAGTPWTLANGAVVPEGVQLGSWALELEPATLERVLELEGGKYILGFLHASNEQVESLRLELTIDGGEETSVVQKDFTVVDVSSDTTNEWTQQFVEFEVPRQVGKNRAGVQLKLSTLRVGQIDGGDISPTIEDVYSSARIDDVRLVVVEAFHTPVDPVDLALSLQPGELEGIKVIELSWNEDPRVRLQEASDPNGPWSQIETSGSSHTVPVIPIGFLPPVPGQEPINTVSRFYRLTEIRDENIRE